MSGSRRAVFLDRDGVLNRNVFYRDTGKWEAPRTAAELEPTSSCAEALRRLAHAGWLLFLVSNQPNAAKGKCAPKDLQTIDEKLQQYFAAHEVALDAVYYCYHHPDFTGPCKCRKPETYFLEVAAREHDLDLSQAWMIGDRPTDIECGARAGTSTIWIDNREDISQVKTADYRAGSLDEAANLILAIHAVGMRRTGSACAGR